MKDKKKKKEICKWDRDEIESSIDFLLEQARNANYACKKCGRVAETKALLCKPLSENKA
ncbi:hypothetical protein [Novipirellula aureliae]|uniref:hypothetical protein n=1 Tax=Novipirellula aureliae TaxID=2527966 RepID=UPI0018CFD6A3|nr:hypothetical protein [Novipirellula aureliae]